MFDPESAITIAKALKSIEPEIGGGLERLSQEALESLPHTVKLITGAGGKSLELPGSIAHLERVGEYATDSGVYNRSFFRDQISRLGRNENEIDNVIAHEDSGHHAMISYNPPAGESAAARESANADAYTYRFHGQPLQDVGAAETQVIPPAAVKKNFLDLPELNIE